METFGSFPGGDTEPPVDEMLQNMIANRADIQNVINALAQGIGEGISASDAALTTVAKPIKTALTRAVNANGGQLNAVVDSVNGAIGNNLAENQVQLAMLQHANPDLIIQSRLQPPAPPTQIINPPPPSNIPNTGNTPPTMPPDPSSQVATWTIMYNCRDRQLAIAPGIVTAPDSANNYDSSVWRPGINWTGTLGSVTRWVTENGFSYFKSVCK